jgi:hypothetical protein
MAYGTVYVFNLYSTSASITQLNGQGPAGKAIPAPTKGTAAPYYAPQQTSVPRTNLQISQLNEPLFVNEQNPGEVNELTINYGGQAWKAKLAIPVPPDPTLEADLWLYLAYQQAFLFNSTDGAVIRQPGGAVSADLVAADLVSN